jgi:co-chaperonin GroES (HSP10)
MNIRKQLFKEVFNVDNPDALFKPVSRITLVQIYQSAETTQSGFEMPRSVIESMQLENRIGRVLAIGPHSYDDPDFFPSGPLVKEGDWVIYSRHDASFLTLRGVHCAILPSNKHLATTEMKEEIFTRYHTGK